MSKKHILLSILLSLTGILHAQYTQVPQVLTGNPLIGGYYEALPAGYASNNASYPVIIFLHGLGEEGDGTSQLSTVLRHGPPKLLNNGQFPNSFTVGGQTFSPIIISPQCRGVAYKEAIQQFVEYLKRTYRIDEKRIYFTGLSNGGRGVWEVVSASDEMAKTFAAIVPVCGASDPIWNLNEPLVIGRNNLPVWALHNDMDPTVNVLFTLNWIRLINLVIPTPVPAARQTIFSSNSHDAWSKAYDPNYRENGMNVYEWMLQYRNDRVITPPRPSPPVAKAGSDISISLPASAVVLDGSASYDPDGTVSAYTWTKVSGPDAGNIVSAGTAKTDVTGLTIAGDYVYELSVKDNTGATATDQVKVTVTNTPNKPPVANAGYNTTIQLPVNSVQLDGTGSTDPDGIILYYFWEKLSGPAGGNITNSNISKTTVTGYTLPGNYVYSLTVTDNNGAYFKGNVTITVLAADAGNKPPVASAGYNTTIQLPINSTQLDGTASADPDGIISYYFWEKWGGPAGGDISISNTVKTTITGYTLAGDYVYKLTVTDNKGATSFNYVTITVLAADAGNKPPVASAGYNTTIRLPVNSVQLDGTGSSDPDGIVAYYSWEKWGGPAGGDISISNTVKTTVSSYTLAGDYVYKLTVTDNKGATSFNYVTITVLAADAGNKPPVASAGYNTTIQLPVNSVQLDGTGSSDPDGIISYYSWEKTGGPAGGNITTSNAVKTTVTGYTLEGNYVYKLTVTDNHGATSSSNVTITVSPAAAVNTAPVARVNGDMTIYIPNSTAFLDGSASSDADGSIVSYSWQKISGMPGGNIVSSSSAGTVVQDLYIPDVYTYQLTVTDNKGATATSRVKVTVLLTDINNPPVARVNSDIAIVSPVSIANLDGSASSDGDGNIVSYSWKKISGMPGGNIVSASSAKTLIQDLYIPDVYTYQLTVTDNKGATASSNVKITVSLAGSNNNNNNGGSTSPVAAKVNSDITITMPASTATVDGSTSTGSITSYSWKKISGMPGGNIVSPSSARTLIQDLYIPDTYVYELTVRDNNNATSTARVTIIVLPKLSVAKVSMINSNDLLNSVKLYPNPASDRIRLDIARNGTHKVVIRIYELGGMLRKEVNATFTDRLMQDIYVNTLPNGYYVIHVSGGPDFIWSSRFLKIGN